MNSLLDDTDSRVRHFPGLSRIGALIADPPRRDALVANGRHRAPGRRTDDDRGTVALGGERASRAADRRRPARARSERTASLLPHRDARHCRRHRSARESRTGERAATHAGTAAFRRASGDALRAHVLRPSRGRTCSAAFRPDDRAQLARGGRRSDAIPDANANPRPRSARHDARRRAGIRRTRHRHESAARAAAGSRVRASTGASAGRISAARSARRFWKRASRTAGSSTPRSAACCA